MGSHLSKVLACDGTMLWRVLLLAAALRVYVAVRDAFVAFHAGFFPKRLSGKKSSLMKLESEDVAGLQHFLEGDSREFRARAKEYMLKRWDVFTVNADQEWGKSVEDQRASALSRAKCFVDSGLVSVRDILRDPLKFLAAHEVIAISCASATYLFSVHFNLFGGSVLKLGTEKHHKKYLEGIDSMTGLPGCFALTETGNGVISGMSMDTTATYDHETQEFIIHSPTPESQKNWISFAANHAQGCVVFVDLITGKKGATISEGVHAIYVPIRSKAGKVLKGVTILDQGHKPCINGNDNGRISFDHVRVPRDNLLDRWGSVAPDGTYTAKIEKLRHRFLKVSDQLMSGRMAISSCAVVLAAQALIGATRYACRRKQRVKQMPGGEIALFEYFTTRSVLLPHLAKAYALRCATNYVKSRYSEMVLRAGEAGANDKYRNDDEVIRLVCSFKAYNTLWSERATASCREKVGGQGLMSCNKLADLNNVAASLVVVEGDSMVLSQKVARELMFAFSGKGVVSTVAALAKSKAKRALINAGLSAKALFAIDGSSTAASSSFHLELLKLRLETLIANLVSSLLLRGIIVGKKTVMEAWAKEHLDTVIAINHAFVEYTALEQFHRAIKSQKVDAAVTPKTISTLKHMASLFALSTLDGHMTWFLQNTSLPSCLSRAITAEGRRLVTSTSPQDALALVEAFGHPADIMCMPIANDSLPAGY